MSSSKDNQTPYERLGSISADTIPKCNICEDTFEFEETSYLHTNDQTDIVARDIFSCPNNHGKIARIRCPDCDAFWRVW